MTTAMPLPLQSRRKERPIHTSARRQVDPWQGVRLQSPSELPISQAWATLVSALRRHQVTIIVGETGSGKTTQIPKALVEAGCGRGKRIVCTQPRRVAAVTVASRVREELGPKGVELCGYRIRFRSRVRPNSRIHFVTDGLLLSEVRTDPLLSRYDAVMVDEAHERSLNIDFLLGILRQVLKKRKDLKVVITSATLDVSVFKEAFPDAPVIRVPGRQFPVKIEYMDEFDDDSQEFLDKVVSAVETLQERGDRSDVLCFLPTERSIIEASRLIEARFKDALVILPLYSRLAQRYQKRVFKGYSRPKIILATNVAETSLTIPGIRVVIDTGLARIARYNIRTRTKSLPVQSISKASADQRAGRAGRTGPGLCIRLYSEADYMGFDQHTTPEIRRSNLGEIILRMLDMGIGDPAHFPFVDPPNKKALSEGIRTLKELGAIDERGSITRLGRFMAKLPLEPRIARMVIEGKRLGVLKEVVIIGSVLSIQDPRAADSAKGKGKEGWKIFSDKYSDFVTLLRIWQWFKGIKRDGQSKSSLKDLCHDYDLSYEKMEEWQDIYAEIKGILVEHGYRFGEQRPFSYEALHKAILSGFLSNVALRQKDGSYLGAHGLKLHIFPGSSVAKSNPEWIVAAEIYKTSRTFARIVAKVEPQWIQDVGAPFLKKHYGEPHWEKGRGAVMVMERSTLWGLTVNPGQPVRFDKIDPEGARRIFIRDGLCTGETSPKLPFSRHNQKVLKEASELEEKVRDPEIIQDPMVLYEFFDKALSELEGVFSKKTLISNERTLATAIRRAGSDAALRLSLDMVLRKRPSPEELSLFPGSITVDGHKIRLMYRFTPGTKEDGVTAVIPMALVGRISPIPFQWLVPGLLPKKIEALIRGLPRGMRKRLLPIDDTVMRIVGQGDGRDVYTPLRAWLSVRIKELFQITIPYHQWPKEEDLPQDLRFRFQVMEKGRVVVEGRDIEIITGKWAVSEGHGAEERTRIEEEKKRFEKRVEGIQSLRLLEHPIIIKGSPLSGTSLWPGLSLERGKDLWLRLFLEKKEAKVRTLEGTRVLMARELRQEIAQIKRRLEFDRLPQRFFLYCGGREKAISCTMSFLLKGHLWPGGMDVTIDTFQARLATLKKTLYANVISDWNSFYEFVNNWCKTWEEVKRLFGEKRKDAGRGHMSKFIVELESILPREFYHALEPEELPDLILMTKALSIRVRRCYENPIKDKKKAEEVAPFERFLEVISQRLDENDVTPEFKAQIKEFSRMLRLYKVAVFAPEVKSNSRPVSQKMLKGLMESIKIKAPFKME